MYFTQCTLHYSIVHCRKILARCHQIIPHCSALTKSLFQGGPWAIVTFLTGSNNGLMKGGREKEHIHMNSLP